MTEIPTVRPVALVTLDLDDTLWPVVPTLEAAERALSLWLEQHAPAVATRFDLDELRAMRLALASQRQDRAHDMNWLRIEGLRRACAMAGEDVSLADEAFAVFYRVRQRVSLYDDVLPVLSRWRSRGLRLAAISNGNADIRQVGIADWFDVSISAHEVGFAKPDPRMFEAACARLELSSDQALHVGDDLELDVRAARAAGLQALWLRRPELDSPAVRRLADQTGEAMLPDLEAIDRLMVAA